MGKLGKGGRHGLGGGGLAKQNTQKGRLGENSWEPLI